MTAETFPHPPPEALAAFGAGRLDGPAAAAIEDHVAGCASCSAAVDALLADDFVASLRDAYPLTTRDDGVPDAMRDHPRYRIIGLLGRGGMGAVYRAEHKLMGRTVALKVIAPRLLARPGAAERFRHEVRAAARLVHRNIVTAYDAEQVGPLTVLVMECVEGRTLADILHERGPLPPAEACEYVRQAAEGLAYAHASGTVHRDIKPHNLMLAADGTVKILDFGLSRFVSVEPPAAVLLDPSADTASSRGDGLTDDGELMGTRDYMAPEQARDPRQADARSDVFALGATLCKLLTGATAIGGPVAGVPPPLVAVCRRAMALEPAERYPSAQAFAADIERVLTGEPVTAFAESAAAHLRRWVRRRVWLLSGLVAALAVGGLAYGLLAWQQESARREAAARKVTRAALDAMVSGVTGESLETQAALTAEQKTFLNSVLGYYQEFAAEPGEDRAGRERLAAAHDRLALIRSRLGQRGESAAVFERAATLHGALAADFPSESAYRSRQARSLNGRGVQLRELGRRAEAEAAYRTALAIQVKLAADAPTVPDYRYEEAVSHFNLGGVLADLGRHVDAEAEYQAAIGIQKQLIAQLPAAAAHRYALARSQSGLADLVGDLGRVEEAVKTYHAAQTELEALAKQFPNVLAYRQELGRVFNSLGILHGDQGQRAAAEAAYRAALVVEAKLAADAPGVPDYRQALARTYSKFGVELMDAGRKPEAEESYRSAIALQEKLVADGPTVPAYRHELARSHNNLGNLLDDWDRRDEAEVAYRVALTIREQLAADFPAVLAYRQDLANIHNNLGTLVAARGRPADAEAIFRSAIALYQRLADDLPAVPDHRRYLAMAHNNRANQLRRLGRPADAESAYRTALALRMKLAADHADTAAYRLHVSETVSLLSGLLIETGRVAEAVRLAEAMLEGAPPPTGALYNAACVLALAAAAANNPDAESHAARSVDLLRRALAQGYRNVAQILADTDLNALRRRADYADLIWLIADGVRDRGQ